MTISGEREEVVIDDNVPYHRQILELLRQILVKLSDIHEELANQPTILINEDGNIIDEGSDDSYESPV